MIQRSKVTRAALRRGKVSPPSPVQARSLPSRPATGELYRIGKSFRQKCPRQSHAAWQPPDHRADPLTLLKRSRISGYLGKSDSFDEAIADFSITYADQCERDYEVLQRAVRAGKLQVAPLEQAK
jgi:hypothetical protein